MPAPVPVVMHNVAEVGPARSRALPHFVVDVRRHVGWLAVADGRASAGRTRLARDRPCRSHPCVACRSHRAASPLRRCVPTWTARLCFRAASIINSPSARIVAARLLDIHVLACRASENGRRAMPVIRSGAHERVDVFVIQDPAEVTDGLRCPCRRLLPPLPPPSRHEVESVSQTYLTSTFGIFA